jgi:hypothetical protein
MSYNKLFKLINVGITKYALCILKIEEDSMIVT